MLSVKTEHYLKDHAHLPCSYWQNATQLTAKQMSGELTRTEMPVTHDQKRERSTSKLRIWQLRHCEQLASVTSLLNGCNEELTAVHSGHMLNQGCLKSSFNDTQYIYIWWSKFGLEKDIAPNGAMRIFWIPISRVKSGGIDKTCWKIENWHNSLKL